MAKWFKFVGDGAAFTPKKQQALGYVFRKMAPEIFEGSSDQQVFDAVCLMVKTNTLTVEIKIEAEGSIEIKWETRLPQQSDVRKMVEAQSIGIKADQAIPVGTMGVDE